MSIPPSGQFVLTLSCADRIGIVHAVSGFLVAHDCNIIDSQQFLEEPGGRFFLRVQATFPHAASIEGLRAAFQASADIYGMDWTLTDVSTRVPTIIMVSQSDHCLTELLERWRSGNLPIDIAAIVSNHPDLEPNATRLGIPFRHIPATAETKPAAEAALAELLMQHDVQLVVLARYMQILSDDFCASLPNRVINIHHSFLPGFKGAKPYHQAHARGVKLVGATAHYVTADLDEGPIIEQQVFRVDHRSTAEDLVVAGREAERAALARAVKWHAEHRVMVSGHRTVVFN